MTALLTVSICADGMVLDYIQYGMESVSLLFSGGVLAKDPLGLTYYIFLYMFGILNNPILIYILVLKIF